MNKEDRLHSFGICDNVEGPIRPQKSQKKMKILGPLGRCSAAFLAEEADGSSRLGWGAHKLKNIDRTVWKRVEKRQVWKSPGNFGRFLVRPVETAIAVGFICKKRCGGSPRGPKIVIFLIFRL